ncbi:MAG: xanthine dehydrogenase family protein subunit M [Vulcanimicrobiaceae bacterium]|jgi:carbon-monoxide dehydrogenase medium subunit
MAAFEYLEPATLEGAFDALERGGEEAHVLAGGTALVLLMRLGLVLPSFVVGMRRIEGLREIGISKEGGLEIGALVTHAEIEGSALVQRFFAPLAQTFGRVATVRIRNQATIGGNLVHADPASDPPPMLIAMDAEIVVARRGGVRTISAADFFRDLFEVALEPGEIVTAIRIPPPPRGMLGTYVKFLPASQDDFATVSVAATLRLDPNGGCEDVRLALGSVASTPLRARRAEEALRGKRITRETIDAAAAIVAEDVDPLDDARGSAGYKREMARVWTRRALGELVPA